MATGSIYCRGRQYGGGGSGTGGHVIKDNSVDLAARAGLNFVGFDLQDDETNDESDVMAHRITQGELSEIIGSDVPPSYVTLAVYDKTGTENEIGIYVDALGNRKKLYEKVVTGTMCTGTFGVVSTDLPECEFCELCSFLVSYDGYVKNMIDAVALATDGSEIVMLLAEDSVYQNQTFYARVHYCKVPTVEPTPEPEPEEPGE